MEEEEGSSSKSLSSLADFDDILMSIFKLLPMKELQKCSKVCKKWHALSTIVKKSRHAIGWFMFSPQLHSHELQPQIADKLQLLSSEPKLCLLFMTNSLYEDHIAVPGVCEHSERAVHPRAAKQEKMVFADYLLRLLPTNCHLIGISADGNVGTDWGLTECLEAENAVAASGILLPELNGITVHKFTSTLVELSQKFTDSVIQEDELRAITKIPESERPKLILLFMSEHVNDLALPALLVLQHRNVVVAGGLVDGILPMHETDQANSDDFLLGLTFCGGNNLRVSSVIVPGEINTETGVTSLLKKLQKTHVCDGARQSIGFMFACIGRGQYHFRGKPSVEASAFHTLFPHVPLFGFFGNGEIGCDYLPDYSQVDGDNNICLVEEVEGEEQVPPLHHAYTTIFVIIAVV